MGKKFHLSQDGVLRECNATGKCPVAPPLFHYDESVIKEKEKDIDRYNELRAKKVYSDIKLSSMLNSSRNISENCFILNEESIPDLNDIDLLVILEETKEKSVKINEEYDKIEKEISTLEFQRDNLEEEYNEVCSEEYYEKWKERYLKENNIDPSELENKKLKLKASFKVYYTDDSEEVFKDKEFIYDSDEMENIYEIEGVTKEIDFVVFEDRKIETEISRYKINKRISGGKNTRSPVYEAINNSYKDYKEDFLKELNNTDSTLAQLEYDFYELELEKTEKDRVIELVEKEIENRSQ